MQSVMEQKRKHRRYGVSLPIHIESEKEDGSVLSEDTITQDLSARGVYLVLSDDLELSSKIQMELTLPPEITQGKAVRVRCRGRVVRIDRKNGDKSIGVAATIDKYEFIRMN